MRWRLVAVLVGIVVLVLAAQNIPLARHLRSVERDRLITELERDAFTLAGRSATAMRLANFSTVSPRLTSTTFSRSGCAEAISGAVMRRNVARDSRKLLSTASVRFFAA